VVGIRVPAHPDRDVCDVLLVAGPAIEGRVPFGNVASRRCDDRQQSSQFPEATPDWKALTLDRVVRELELRLSLGSRTDWRNPAGLDAQYVVRWLFQLPGERRKTGNASDGGEHRSCSHRSQRSGTSTAAPAGIQGGDVALFLFGLLPAASVIFLVGRYLRKSRR